MIRILPLGTGLVFLRPFSNKNVISIFKVEFFSAWRKRSMVTENVSYCSWSRRGAGV